MKKTICLMIAVCALLGTLWACGGGEDITDTAEKTATEAPETAYFTETAAQTVRETEPVTAEPVDLPDYYIDFRDEENVYACTGLYNVTAEPSENGMIIHFLPSGDNKDDPDYCFDPYMTLPLPGGNFSIDEYPYFVMILDTSRNDMQGDIRYRTDKLKNGASYPTYRFTYKTTGKQKIMLDLGASSVLFIADEDRPVKGNYNDLRMDMFENHADTGDYFEIYCCAFFKSYKEAYKFNGLPERNDTGKTQKQDLSAYFKGNEFSDPGNAYKPMKVAYGFNSGYSYTLKTLLNSGYGGVVSNVNFNERYLKDESEFEILKKTYNEAASLGMKTWIYDEYQWPSGKAYGQVLEGHDEYEANGIELLTSEGVGNIDYTLPSNYISIAGATVVRGGKISTPKINGNKISDGGSGKYTLYVYARRITNQKKEVKGDFTTLRDVDLLNPDAVKRFIDLTYRKYKDEFGDSFSLVEAFFTDEPQLGNRDMKNYVVWSDGLPAKFREMHGYDITDHLYSLFFGDTNEDKIVRVNYYQTVSEMFCEAYFRQIADWCEKNGCASSGHMLFEEQMQRQIETYGGDFMQLVGSMTIPGADILQVEPENLMSASTDIGNFMGLKYVSSAAKNAGKTKVFLEFNPAAVTNAKFFSDKLNYAVGGATLSYFFGANTIATIIGDSQMSASELKTVNEYMGRIDVMLESAVSASEIGVFYPINSARSFYTADGSHFNYAGSSYVSRLNKFTVGVCSEIIYAGLDYTMLDEQSISSGSVKNGKIKIGLGEYSVIVMPDVSVMGYDAAERLAEFEKSGGKILWLKRKPELCSDMRDQTGFETLMKKFSGNVFSGSVSEELKKLCPPTVKLEAEKGIFLSECKRTDNGMSVWFIASSLAKQKTVKIELDGDYLVYDPYNASVSEKSGGSELTLGGYRGLLIIKK